MSIPYIETPTIEELISSQQEDPAPADQFSIVTITNFGPGVVDTDDIGYIIESGLAAQENNSGIIVTIDAMWDNEQVEGYLFEQRPKDGAWETIAQLPKLVTDTIPGFGTYTFPGNFYYFCSNIIIILTHIYRSSTIF